MYFTLQTSTSNISCALRAVSLRLRKFFSVNQQNFLTVKLKAMPYQIFMRMKQYQYLPLDLLLYLLSLGDLLLYLLSLGDLLRPP